MERTHSVFISPAGVPARHRLAGGAALAVRLLAACGSATQRPRRASSQPAVVGHRS